MVNRGIQTLAEWHESKQGRRTCVPAVSGGGGKREGRRLAQILFIFKKEINVEGIESLNGG